VSKILEVVARYRAALLRRERVEILRLTREYVEVWKSLRGSLDELSRSILSEGADATYGWLLRQRRYRALMNQVEREIQTWAKRAGLSAADLQVFGLSLGAAYAPEIASAVAGGLVTLPHGAIETMSGLTADGSPLASLFDGIGAMARVEWEKALMLGVTTGKGPAVIARMAHEATATGLARATTIARTEMLRAFRVSAHETARQNPRVISGWMWCAALSTETCAACIAMHGTIHPMDEDFNDHPNGRCCALYITPGMDADTLRRRLPDAQKWLKSLSDDQLARIFGKGAADVWKSGRVSLRKFAALKRNDIWGDTYQPTPLRQLLEEM